MKRNSRKAIAAIVSRTISLAARSQGRWSSGIAILVIHIRDSKMTIAELVRGELSYNGVKLP
jgi:hypothetical protein